jgi:hypothetical protein
VGIDCGQPFLYATRAFRNSQCASKLGTAEAHGQERSREQIAEFSLWSCRARVQPVARYFVLAQEIAQYAIGLLEKLLAHGAHKVLVADKIRHSRARNGATALAMPSPISRTVAMGSPKSAAVFSTHGRKYPPCCDGIRAAIKTQPRQPSMHTNTPPLPCPQVASRCDG